MRTHLRSLRVRSKLRTHTNTPHHATPRHTTPHKHQSLHPSAKGRSCSTHTTSPSQHNQKEVGVQVSLVDFVCPTTKTAEEESRARGPAWTIGRRMQKTRLSKWLERANDPNAHNAYVPTNTVKGRHQSQDGETRCTVTYARGTVARQTHDVVRNMGEGGRQGGREGEQSVRGLELQTEVMEWTSYHPFPATHPSTRP
jgi:hypothetical protein